MSRKILLLGSSEDSTSNYILENVTEENLDFFDVNSLKSKNLKILGSVDSPVVKIEEQVFFLDQYDSYFQRFWPTSVLLDGNNHKALKAINIVNAFLRHSPKIVINRPRSGYSNASKILHSHLNREFGFNVPTTFSTSQAEIAQKKMLEPWKWVSKGISGMRTRAMEQSVADELYLKQLRVAPVVFQKKLTGVEYRVHVLGRKVFSTRIECDRIDYRYAMKESSCVDFLESEIPKMLESRCIDYCNKYDMVLAGFDFFYDSNNDEWYLLEVNPSPGFDFFDRRLNGKIVKELQLILGKGSVDKRELELSLDELDPTEPFIEPFRRQPVKY